MLPKSPILLGLTLFDTVTIADHRAHEAKIGYQTW